MDGSEQTAVPDQKEQTDPGLHIASSSFRHLPYSLAHLSWRLTRWAHSIPMVCHPSVAFIHTFKLEYRWSQLANLDQILCVASLGWGRGCIRFWGRLDQNSGFHGNRKPPLTYNRENDVSTFSRLFLIRSFLYFPGYEDMHKISEEFEFWPDRTTDYGVGCPWAFKTFPIDLQTRQKLFSRFAAEHPLREICFFAEKKLIRRGFSPQKFVEKLHESLRRNSATFRGETPCDFTEKLSEI